MKFERKRKNNNRTLWLLLALLVVVILLMMLLPDVPDVPGAKTSGSEPAPVQTEQTVQEGGAEAESEAGQTAE